ncbi:MAG TPA: hypothetical protein DCX07_03285 [Phycisphaerales bacterium]|nr:hypothetical protein [Phycisphaerales bacterium]
MRYHLCWGTYGSWLPGDPRGFRTRHHCRHVEGDYRHPPPPGEYSALCAHAKRSLKKPPVEIAPPLRETIARACLEQFVKESIDVFAIAVDSWHVHAAVECPSAGIKQCLGRVKKVSSHRVRRCIPGRLWQAGCHVVAVRDERHWKTLLGYITAHAPAAWVWQKECPRADAKKQTRV